MKCNLVINIIDKRDPGKSIKLTKDILAHIDTCQNCSAYYNASLQTEKLVRVLQQSEPKLNHPGQLTDDILHAISDAGKHEDNITSLQSKPHIFQIAQRLLAAASVCLMLVFGLEQYIVVDKLVRLQTHTSSVSESNSRQHFIQLSKVYDPVVVFETIQNELTSNFNNHKQLNFRTMLVVAQFKSADINQYDLQRYAQLKSFIQNQTQEAYD